MADIARRSIPKVTYAPITPSADDASSGTILKRQRGIDKIAFATSLRASAADIDGAKKFVPEGDLGRQAQEALNLIGAASARATARSAWKAIARLAPAVLAAAGRALAEFRRSQRSELKKLAQTLVADHAKHVRREIEAAAPSDTSIRVVERAGPLAAAAPRVVANDDTLAPIPPPTAPNPWKPTAESDPRLTAEHLKTSLGKAVEWARVSDPGRVDKLGTLARVITGVKADHGNMVNATFDHVIEPTVVTGEDAEDWTDDLTDGFEERMKVEPVGRLHLERIDMSPAGIVRGELMHSVGLAPKETITLIHREWSSRETSFEKVVSEEFEQSSEEGVTENTELASATETQSKHSTSLSTEATASASYLFASGSVTVGYNTSSDDETAKRDSRNHSVSVTRKASSRTRKEHKVTFTVKEQAGVEDESIRTLSNASESEPMRVDFHQMLRKWKCDLYRHGLRLTYDIVVPAPGIDLLDKVDELRRIEYQLSQPFAFSLQPATITRGNWLSLAGQYGADVEAPPPATLQLRKQAIFPHLSEGDSDDGRFETFEFDIPEGYRVSRGNFFAPVLLYKKGWFDVEDDPTGPVYRDPNDANGNHLYGYRSGLTHLIGRTTQVAVVMFFYKVTSGYAEATLDVAQTLESWQAWQHRAWATMRKAAEDAWNMQRQDLGVRRDRLNDELSKWDPLTLRQMEREEIMKTTLKWIFGPAFDLMPSEVGRLYSGEPGGLASLEPSRLTTAQWATAMGLGEFIKFLHQAIEWENVLYFIYPYFWDTPRNHSLKRFLQHPDALHRNFLRGGAARVVLTVRPGFEESFTRLFETGSLDDELGPDHPYLAIATEIQNYAKTNYPGIPASTEAIEADADEVDAAERGKLIARWYEHTPVSALDISVNTPLEQLR